MLTKHEDRRDGYRRYQVGKRARTTISGRYNQGNAELNLSSLGKKVRIPSRRIPNTKSDEVIYKENIIEDQTKVFKPMPQSIIQNESLKKSRKDILKWIYHFGNKLDQSEVTIQTAMVYIDKMVALNKTTELEKNKYGWAATALLVASKFCEIDYKLIRIFELTGKS